jgi:flagellar motor protein MotB
MDSLEKKASEQKNSKDFKSQLIKQSVKNTTSQTEFKQIASGQPGFSGFMSGSFDGTIGDDILFSRETPRTVPWSIAWADVMMTMFILFAALYIFKAATKEKVVVHREVRTVYTEKIKSVPQDAGHTQSQGEQSIQEIYNLSKQTLNSASSVELVPDKAVRIILRSDLLFDLGKADIKEDAKASLKEVAEVLRQNSNMINVVGHTDDLPINTGKFPSNWELSTARACQIARFLMKDLNIPEERFYISGHASYQPVKPNTDEINRAANRRVEIIITKERPCGVNQGIQ